VGFSQGAMMSYEVALRHPEAVGGIAALSGRILPVLKSGLKPDEKRQQLAIFIGHGTADTLLPYKDGTDADSLLQSLSLKPEFHAYPGVGHSISGTEMTGHCSRSANRTTRSRMTCQREGPGQTAS